jgi:hypothetical protein
MVSIINGYCVNVCPTRGYFVGTGPSPQVGGLYCASLAAGTLTNVYVTSTLGEGPIPSNPTLEHVDVVTVASPTVWVDEIQVRWHASDTEILRLLSGQPVAATDSQSMLQASPSSESSSSRATSSTGGLSTSAKIAIGVAIPVVVIFILLGILIWWMRKRKVQKSATLQLPVDPSPSGPSELDAQYNERPSKGELPTTEMWKPPIQLIAEMEAVPSDFAKQSTVRIP